MNLIKKMTNAVFVFWLLGSTANSQEMTALETAELGVKTLLQTAIESKEFFLSDREEYFSRIEEVLLSFVDFDAVAEVVMSRYVSESTEQQTARFAAILRTTLTRFYGASLVSYNGEELIFLPPSNPDADPKEDVVVGMELQGDTALRLQYQMFLNENDEWKLKNLSLAGINLGRQYYTQFAALMAQHNNDIDVVLDNWK